jgi:hypothetical protein
VHSGLLNNEIRTSVMSLCYFLESDGVSRKSCARNVNILVVCSRVTV